VRPGTLSAAILRSPHAHATIRAIKTDAAHKARGVAAVITAADVTKLSSSLGVAIKAPIECWPIATDRVRYVGEPVAVVVATDRCLAERALAPTEVTYEPLPAVMDPVAALSPMQELIHEKLGSNLVSERTFRYGDPEAAFRESELRIAVNVHYPRNSCTPIETFGLVAEYLP